MAKNKISEFSSTPANNTDIGGIDIAEGCAPSGINNAIRELMAQLKDQQAGTDADNFTVGGNLSVTGNVVLGATPSAWGSSVKAIENESGALFSIGTNSLRMYQNAYYNSAGSNIYETTNPASAYIQTSGQHQFFNAPSGTAGNVATFTKAMTLDASGNLLVGTTSAFIANGHNFQNANSAAFVMALRNANATSGSYWIQGPDNNNAYILYNQSNTGVYLTNGGTSWAANSDERLKTELTPFANAAQKVCSLRAGTGRYLTDEETVSRSFLIAQDVQAVLPEAVNVQSDEQGTLGLSYTDLIPLLTAAIQEQQALITNLTARLELLEGK
jgi:hypothetical protein